MFTTRNLLMLVGREAIIAVLSVVMATMFIYYFSSKIESSTTAIVKNRALAMELEKRTSLLSALKSDVETIGDGDKKIEQAFPPADNILEFITALEELAFKNGMTQTLHFDTPTSAGGSTSLPLATIHYANTLSGNMDSLLGYLKEFERFPYFTRIDNVTIMGQSKETGIYGPLTASYSATLFAREAR